MANTEPLGSSDLRALLAGLDPVADARTWVFTRVAEVPADLHAVVTVAEAEGTTLVVEQGEADRLDLAYGPLLGWITLRVHSSLEAVGLTAAVSAALTAAGISANVVAGYAHDHLFVPRARTADALAVLRSLAARP